MPPVLDQLDQLITEQEAAVENARNQFQAEQQRLTDLRALRSVMVKETPQFEQFKKLVVQNHTRWR